VQYIDVFAPEMAEHQAALDVLGQGSVPLPIISINGQPTFAGGIALEMIVQELGQLGLVAA
jgi:hypothetical protein